MSKKLFEKLLTKGNIFVIMCKVKKLTIFYGGNI